MTLRRVKKYGTYSEQGWLQGKVLGKMRNEKLKSVAVYFNPEEFEHISEEANDHGVTVSAYIRARLGLPVRERGAPSGKRQQRRVSKAGVGRPGDKRQ